MTRNLSIHGFRIHTMTELANRLSKRNWNNESKLTCKNWLHSMHWNWMKLRFLKKLELCAVHDGVVNPIVANAADALKRCVT